MSNQIQPPSSNGDRSMSNSTEARAPTSESVAGPPLPLETASPPMVIRAPVALDLYTSTRAVPVSSTRNTTDSRMDQRRQ